MSQLQETSPRAGASGVVSGGGGGGDFYTHSIPNSCRFSANSTSANSSRLTKTFGTVDSSVHFTLNFWIKRSAIEGTNPITSARPLDIFTPRSGTSATNLMELKFSSPTAGNTAGDALMLVNTNSNAIVLSTDNLFRDTSAWYNIHIQADLDNGTNSEKLKFFINGTEASYNTDNRGSFSSFSGIAAGAWTIGDYYGYGYPIQSYIAQWAYVDGYTHPPTVFSEEKNGVWIPKDLSSGITWGSAGHLLMFQDGSNFGDDTSGEGNDWASHKIFRQLTDSPTNNFATWNPLNAGSYTTLSEGNLQTTGTGSGASNPSGSFAVTSGKWYWEMLIKDYVSGYPYTGLTVLGNIANSATTGGDIWAMRYDIGSGAVQGNSGANITGLGSLTTVTTGVATATDGDIISYYLDCDNRKAWIAKNGTIPNSGNPETGAYPQWAWTTTPANPITFTAQIYNGDDTILNAGQEPTFTGEISGASNNGGGDKNLGTFKYDPKGYLALCSGNLPTADAVDPAQTDSNFPQKLFSATIWTGNNAVGRAITGVGFKTDWIWFKARDYDSSNRLYDTTRGIASNGGKRLFTNTNAAENDQTSGQDISAIGSDGFTTGGSTKLYTNFDDNDGGHVGWLWRANGGTTSSGSGDLTSTHQVDPSGGFSIVKAVGDGGSGDKTVSHGLSSAPTVILAKNRDTTYNWDTYFAEGVSAGSGMRLNTSEAPFTGRWGTVNSSIFTCKQNYTWASTNNYIYYCFTNIDGYIRAGTYKGNGSTNGQFIYTGHKPAWIMLKRYNRSGDFWYIIDASRNPFNGTGARLLNPDRNVAESSNATTDVIDIYSNGWKFRTAGSGFNGSGGEWVFLSMSSNPFKYATAR